MTNYGLPHESVCSLLLGWFGESEALFLGLPLGLPSQLLAPSRSLGLCARYGHARMQSVLLNCAGMLPLLHASSLLTLQQRYKHGVYLLLLLCHLLDLPADGGHAFLQCDHSRLQSLHLLQQSLKYGTLQGTECRSHTWKATTVLSRLMHGPWHSKSLHLLVTCSLGDPLFCWRKRILG